MGEGIGNGPTNLAGRWESPVSATSTGRRCYELLFSASRLTRCGSRRPLSAVLALAYLWSFVALGLTHTHAAAVMAAAHRSTRAAASAAASGQVIRPAIAPGDDTPCAVCATAHATVVALAQPQPATHAPVLDRPLAVRSSSFAPTRSARLLHPRGPPQDC